MRGVGDGVEGPLGEGCPCRCFAGEQCSCPDSVQRRQTECPVQPCKVSAAFSAHWKRLGRKVLTKTREKACLITMPSSAVLDVLLPSMV